MRWQSALIQLLVASSRPASAGGIPSSEPVRERVYHVHPAIDGVIVGASALATALPYALSNRLLTPSCPCSTSSVNALDRLTLGWDSHLAGYAATALVAGAGIAVAAIDLADIHATGGSWADVGTDVVVLGEAVVVTSGLTTIVKYATHRPFPVVVTGQEPELVGSPAGYRSFWSGHAALSACMTTALAETLWLRHPESRAWEWALVVGGAVTAGAGLLKLADGQHYITDVLVGAPVGATLGYVVPWLHREAPEMAIVPVAGGGVALLAAEW